MADSSSSSRGSGRGNNPPRRGDPRPSVVSPIAIPADALASNVGVAQQFVNPFSSPAHIGLSELSATGLWSFIAANCGSQIAVFETSWSEKNLSGAFILRFHPADFDAELLREFPSMSASVRSALFNFVKLFVARDLAANHALKSYVDPSIGNLWANSTFEQPVAKRAREDLSHGGGSAVFTPPKRSAQAFVFGSPIEPVAVSFGQGAPSFGANALSLGQSAPSSGNSALPFGSNAPPGVHAPPLGSSASNPGAGASSFGQSAPPPPPPVFGPPGNVLAAAVQPAVQVQVASAVFNSSIPLPIQSIDQLSAMLRSKGVAAKPWDIAESIRPKAPVDNFVPGFKRISMFALIIQSKAKATERRSRGEHVPHLQKEIVWPKMHVFSREAFVRCRAKYYECVLQSLMAGIFTTFKECVLGAARLAAMREFKLTESLYLDLDDKVFVDWLTIYFGPKHKEQALVALAHNRISKHTDSSDSQAVFVPKFDTLVYEFELSVNDIFDMAPYWPVDPQHEDYGELSLKEVMLKWLDCFPLDMATSSVQIATCRSFITQNKEILFNDQVVKLRQKFSQRDTRVLDGELAYTTTPIKSTGATASTSRTQRAPAPASTAPAPRIGGRTPGAAAGPRPAGSAVSTADTRAGRNRPRSDQIAPPMQSRNRVTPGNKRCKGCGAENNHWGLGFTKDSCPAFGTSYAVKPGFIWPDSDKMPKVNIPQNEYQDLLRANPRIQQSWDKAKAAKAAARGSVMALDAGEDEDADDYDVDFDDDVNSVQDDALSAHNDDEVNVINCSSLPLNQCANVAELSASDALSLLGNMQQFFGVSRLAGNDEFTAKTLMDPGATMNIISPLCCNRCMVDRRQVQVNIFQGKRKVCTVEEIAKCCFELQHSSGQWVQHVEWFGVHQIGYEMLLGRRFCKDNGFTSASGVRGVEL
jgi:hypothetical protein